MKTDSQTVVKILDRDALHARTKHLRLSFKEIKELIKNRMIEVDHIPGLENPSDICTKTLPRNLHQKHCDFLSPLKSRSDKPARQTGGGYRKN